MAVPHSRYGVTFPNPPATQITYPDVCTWLGSLGFAKKTNNKDLQARLHAKTALLLKEEANLQPKKNHVDNFVFGAIPLAPGQWIWDLRQEPAELEVAAARCAALPCRRLLAVGSDMAVGKMSACLELQAEALRQGLDARFVGTGQAGILISGRGVALDAVRVDYAAGAVEAAVLQAAEGAGPEALVLVEGQGSLCHPGSTATLPLLRGSQPTDLLLVHRAGQSHVRTRPGAVAVAIPPLPEVIAANEAIAALGRPDGHRPRVRAIALNTALLEPEAAAREARRLAELTGLPCLDPVRQGSDALLEALLAP